MPYPSPGSYRHDFCHGYVVEVEDENDDVREWRVVEGLEVDNWELDCPEVVEFGKKEAALAVARNNNAGGSRDNMSADFDGRGPLKSHPIVLRDEGKRSWKSYA